MWLEGMQGERNRQTDAHATDVARAQTTLPIQRVRRFPKFGFGACVGGCVGTGTHLLEPIEVVGVAAERQKVVRDWRHGQPRRRGLQRQAAAQAGQG